MKLKPSIVFLLIIFLNSSSIAQLKLIPTPQIIELQNGNFIIDQKTSIINLSTDNFYTKEVIDEIEEELRITLSIQKKGKRNIIELIKVGDQKKLSKILISNNLNDDFALEKEGYIISITPLIIKIIAQTDAGIYYGIQTLKQLISANRTDNSIPCLTIYDSPDFPVRAWQDDISRGPIPTMDYLKDQIKKMSSFKLNYFTLYTEHVFKLKSHPDIAPDDGITQEDILEISEFADRYHVTLIGNFQSFGHMAKTLAHPKYQYLVENGHILSPVMDESYKFLGEVYSEVVPAYSGEFFNINCDETFGLGTEKSKDLVDSIGIEEVYASHINKIDSLLDPYNKSILMWGDIAGNHPKIIGKLPKDITVMVWGYHAAQSFENAITPISTMGLNFWVAPGVSCWRNIYPDMRVAKINIFNFIRDGYKLNARGVLNTTWDDDGLNFFENNWHGLVWGAENSWNAPSVDLTSEESELERESLYDSFNSSFDKIFFGLDNENLTNQIVKFSDLHSSEIRKLEKNSRLFEPVFPIYMDYVKDGKLEENLKVINYTDSLSDYLNRIKPKVKSNEPAIRYLQFAVDQVNFTGRKNLLRIKIHDYINGDNCTESELKSYISDLVSEVQRLKSQYKELWSLESKEWWLSVNMKKFDKLQDDLEQLYGHCFINFDNNISGKGRMITLNTLFSNLPVYYTFDENGINWKKYQSPIYANKDLKIFAKVIFNDKEYSPTADSIIFHDGVGKLLSLNSTYSDYHPSYDGGGKFALLDGKTGNPEDLRSGRWQGFSGQDIEVEIDMKKPVLLSSFSMGFYQNTFSWVIFPKKIDIYVKNETDGDYRLISTIENTIPPEEDGALKHVYSTKIEGVSGRFVKVIAHYYGKLPEWHHAGSNYESMLFADEIILEVE